MLKDLEDMQLKYYDRLEDNENTQGALDNQEQSGDEEKAE
jgi:hypothetical protein